MVQLNKETKLHLIESFEAHAIIALHHLKALFQEPNLFFNDTELTNKFEITVQSITRDLKSYLKRKVL